MFRHTCLFLFLTAGLLGSARSQGMFEPAKDARPQRFAAGFDLGLLTYSGDVDKGGQFNGDHKWLLSASVTGQIKLFRIDPAQASGISISVDWVSVNTGTTALPGAPTVITTVSGGPLTINTPPICHVLQPDGEGGLDYASFIRNNPWNMAEASDIQLTTGLAGGFPQFLLDSTANGVRGDHLRGQNPNGNADPAVFYLFENTMNPIDACLLYTSDAADE